MKHLNAAEDVILYLQKFINNPKTMETYFGTDRKHFIRNRKMPFPELLAFLIQKSANSLDIRLKNWAELFGKSSTQTVSRQAVSKSRQDVPAALFRDMLKETAGLLLQHRENQKNWHGYQIYAIDGTDLQIPTTQETVRDFGNVATRFPKQYAGASASAMYDVLNDVILDSVLCPYKTAEREMAKELISSALGDEKKEKTILVLDRGYPSYNFLEYLYENKIYYVMRIKEQMSHLRSEEMDGEVYRKCGRKCRTIRTIWLELETGAKEYLITNIPKERVESSAFKELYFLRWGIEGKYKELKESLEIENFSSKTSVGIRQDYYSSLLLSNVCALIKKCADKEIEKEKKGEKEYQARRSYLIYQVNRWISRLLLKKENVKERLRQIVEDCKKKRSQIRRYRKCERNSNLNRRKYSINHKSCI